MQPITFENQAIPIAKTTPTPNNTRRMIPGDPRTAELAESFKSNGLLQAVIARPHPKKKGWFELLVGERRLSAAKLLGWETIDARVGSNIDDAKAAELTAVENMQREGLTPLEEARAIDILHTKAGLDFAEIGARLGRSPADCAKRVALLKLAKPWAKAIDSGKLEGWTSAHLQLVARLPDTVQADLFKQAERHFVRSERWTDEESYASVPKLSEWARLISTELMMLSRLPWDIDDATLEPKAGSCTDCPKQTSKVELLFDDDDTKGDKASRCLDRGCFERKAFATVKRKVVELTVGGVKPFVDTDQVWRWYSDPKLRGQVDKAFSGYPRRYWDNKACKKGAKDAVPCVFAGGDRVGQVVYVTKGRVGSSSPGSRQKAKPKISELPPAKQLKVRLATLAKRRETLAVRKVIELVGKLTPGPKAPQIPVETIAHLLAAFGSTRDRSYLEGTYAPDPGWKRFKLGHDEAIKACWPEVIHTITGRMNPDPIEPSRWSKLLADVKAFCDLLGISWKDTLKQATEEIADPAWLRAEKAGGKKKRPTTKNKAAKKAKAKSR